MSFLKTVLKLLGVQGGGFTQTPQNGMSYEEYVDSLERKGQDVTQYREYLAQLEQEKEDYRLKISESINYQKLDSYKNTPRSNNNFIDDVAAIFGKSQKNKDKIASAPLVFGAVVQANNKLYREGDEELVPMVLVFALDSEHIYNEEWLLETAENIFEMKDSYNIPSDVANFIKVLNDDQSIFCFKLGESLSKGADAWCVTYSVPKQKHLPGSIIPTTKILPFLVMEDLRDNYQAKLAIVPSKYYMNN